MWFVLATGVFLPLIGFLDFGVQFDRHRMSVEGMCARLRGAAQDRKVPTLGSGTSIVDALAQQLDAGVIVDSWHVAALATADAGQDRRTGDGPPSPLRIGKVPFPLHVPPQSVVMRSTGDPTLVAGFGAIPPAFSDGTNWTLSLNQRALVAMPANSLRENSRIFTHPVT